MAEAPSRIEKLSLTVAAKKKAGFAFELSFAQAQQSSDEFKLKIKHKHYTLCECDGRWKQPNAPDAGAEVAQTWLFATAQLIF